MGEPTEPQHATYATRAFLCPWFPEADPENERAQTFRTWRTRRKTLLLSAAIIAWAVFITNLTGSILLQFRSDNNRVFTGACSTASKLDSGLHLLINVLSTLLLGACNLTMQLLCAPTRMEVDYAHRSRRWLDIGIPSMRNLRHIARGRRAAWAILAASSLPLHFL